MLGNMKRKQAEARLHPEAGVTLVEMMVVIVIIGLVTAIVVINVLPSQDRARVEKARADIRVLEQALEMYRLNTGRFPTVDEGLDILLPAAQRKNPTPNASGSGSDLTPSEGYIRRLPKDPWNRDYIYVSPGQNARPFELMSLGSDGREGGEGLGADIINWK